MTDIEQKTDDLAREVYEQVYQSRHTPIVLDVFGSARDLILSYADDIRQECADRFCKDCQDRNPVTCSHLENGHICRWVAVIMNKG